MCYRHVSPPGVAQQHSGAILGGGQRASGTGRADGGVVGPVGGDECVAGPDFELTPPHGGYAWWYIDALSDDGASGITLIAFLGSVFSPYYAWARRFGRADPMRHCALNVAVYGKRKRWAMTERGTVHRGSEFLRIGPSALHWDGTALMVQIDEVTVPVPRRIRGTVRLYPLALENRTLALDDAGLHLWQPIAPCARVEVDLQTPAQRWSGFGYFDTNRGARPLEADFVRWDWGRARVGSGTAVLYDVQRRDGRLALGMRYNDAGGVVDFVAPPAVSLPRTRWGVRRNVCAPGSAVVETLEDTPFYARSLIAAEILGAPVTMLHESVALDRFASPAVQAMLPFRMPRSWKS